MINGEKIRVLMRDKEISSRVMASRIGVSESMMSYILQGLREPNVHVLVRIATELDCTVDELLLR